MINNNVRDDNSDVYLYDRYDTMILRAAASFDYLLHGTKTNN